MTTTNHNDSNKRIDLKNNFTGRISAVVPIFKVKIAVHMSP